MITEDENAVKDECDDDLFTSETFQKIILDKQGAPNKYQSYWECDEEDIECWSKKEIDEDPGKQLLTHAENGNFDKLTELVEGINDTEAKLKLLNYKDQDGYTCLHRAAYSNKLDICKYVLKIEYNLMFNKTDMGWSPLHSAAYWNNYEIVDYLLNVNEVNLVNQLTNSKQTALHLAASQRNCRETLILLLLSKFCNYYVANDTNELASTLATRSCEHYRLFEITDRNLNEFILN